MPRKRLSRIVVLLLLATTVSCISLQRATDGRGSAKAGVDGGGARTAGAGGEGHTPNSVRAQQRESIGIRSPMSALIPQTQSAGFSPGLAISSDGRFLAIGGVRGVSLWNLESGLKIDEVNVPNVHTVDLADDAGRVLAIGDFSGVAWDLEMDDRTTLDERALTGASKLAHPLPFLRFASFLSDGRILVCGGGTGDLAAPQLGCRVHGGFFSDSVPGPLLPSTSEGNAYYNLGASVAPDELSVTLVRTTGAAEWLELQPGGRRRSVEIPNAKIGAVAALGGDRLAAGLSDGRIVVIDADTGDVSREFDTERDEISAIVRMDGERLAVGVNNRIMLEGLEDATTFQTSEEEILILSQDDLSILRRLSPVGGRINRLVASDDGRRLVSAARPPRRASSAFGRAEDRKQVPMVFCYGLP